MSGNHRNGGATPPGQGRGREERGNSGAGAQPPPMPSMPPAPPAHPPQPPGGPAGQQQPAWQHQPPQQQPQPGPSPYAQQHQPPQQQPFQQGGAPQSPHWQQGGQPQGWSAPAPAPPARSGSRLAMIIVVVLLVIGGTALGGYLLTGNDSGSGDSAASGDSGGSGSGGSGNGDTKALKVKWTARLPDRELGTLGGLPVLWPSGRNPVYADSNGVRGFDRASGKKLWTVATPKGASELCGAASEPNDDGVAAVAFDAGGNDCSFLVVFDTDTGRTLWAKNLASDFKTVIPEIEVGSSSVVTNMGGGVAAYSITGGAKQWTLFARGHDCGDDAVWTGGFLAVSSSCSDAQPEDQFTLRDLEFGDIYRFPNEHRDVQFVAGDKPVTVIFQGKDDDSPGSVQTYSDDDGKPQKSFPLSGPLAKLEFNHHTFVDPDSSVMVASYGSTSGAGAVDLRTGKLLWSKDEAVPVGSDSGQVIAVMGPGPDGQDPRLVSIGLRDGKERLLGDLATPDHSLGSSIQNLDLSWSAGSLYVIGQDYNHPDNGLILHAFDGQPPSQ